MQQNGCGKFFAAKDKNDSALMKDGKKRLTKSTQKKKTTKGVDDSDVSELDKREEDNGDPIVYPL